MMSSSRSGFRLLGFGSRNWGYTHTQTHTHIHTHTHIRKCTHALMHTGHPSQLRAAPIIWQKRPIISQKRPIIWQKRPMTCVNAHMHSCIQGSTSQCKPLVLIKLSLSHSLSLSLSLWLSLSLCLALALARARALSLARALSRDTKAHVIRFCFFNFLRKTHAYI